VLFFVKILSEVIIWNNAIIVIKNLLSYFPEDYEGYNRFYVFLKTFRVANNLEYSLNKLIINITVL